MPAAIVARELEIRLIDTACMASYHGQQRGQINILKEASLAGDGSRWLIVDDLVDTGETSRALRALLPKAHFATVYAKPAGLPAWHKQLQSALLAIMHAKLARFRLYLQGHQQSATYCRRQLNWPLSKY